MTEIMQAELRRLLSYDPATGIFKWVSHPSERSRAKIGSEAGWLENSGYRRICLHGKAYQAHRLAWLYMTGEWPIDQIDHRNMNKADNRWSNLRIASNSQNQANRPATRRSSSGFKGVYWHSRRKRWHASISVDGRLIHLGYRDTQDEAASLYAAAAQKFFGEFARAS